MENGGPVVGLDAPTGNSKLVKLDNRTADLSLLNSGLAVIRQLRTALCQGTTLVVLQTPEKTCGL
jgi:hypothetical protein